MDEGVKMFVAAYVFILCAQILLFMVIYNDDIIGILIKGKEIKLTQFADDTTLILNGCKRLLVGCIKYYRNIWKHIKPKSKH